MTLKTPRTPEDVRERTRLRVKKWRLNKENRAKERAAQKIYEKTKRCRESSRKRSYAYYLKKKELKETGASNE